MATDLDHWPLVILTLEGEEERRSNLLQKLTELALDYHLHFGVDGRQRLQKKFEDLVDRALAARKNHRNLSDGELACSLSHRSIYNWVIESGHAGAIVLEDDAIVGDRFAQFVSHQAHAAGDIVMLDHSHARVWGKKTVMSDGSSAYTLSLPSCLTTGYTVSASACRYLLEVTSPVSDLADWPGDICSLGALAVHPTLVSHPDPDLGGSHLEEWRRIQKQKYKSSSMSRLLKMTFWRRWATKRLSRRIS